ncbi:hypothetical protein ATY81_25105 [Rhizobium sp. R72]|nr:hypothetical protein ATY81_25105 [Rhizobium sp. R72]OWW00473.1 hypothetical protein ATY80_25105 [Rhizobium sp. R711]
MLEASKRRYEGSTLDRPIVMVGAEVYGDCLARLGATKQPAAGLRRTMSTKGPWDEAGLKRTCFPAACPIRHHARERQSSTLVLGSMPPRYLEFVAFLCMQGPITLEPSAASARRRPFRATLVRISQDACRSRADT